MAGADVQATCCRACWRSSWKSMPAIWPRYRRQWPGDMDRQRRMSIIEEGADPQIRMAYLAIVASFSVNGVAALHSQLLEQTLFRDFYELWPNKFNNKTNGVTQRRWLAWANPSLGKLITEKIGDGWVTDLSQLKRLAPLCRRSGIQGAMARSASDQQGAPCRTGTAGLRHHLRYPRAVRRTGQTHP